MMSTTTTALRRALPARLPRLRLAAGTGSRYQSTNAKVFSSSSSSASSASTSGRLTRYLRNASLVTSIVAGAYTVGSLYPPTIATFISPRPAPPLPDLNDPASIAYLETLEDALQNLPLLQELRARPDADEWYEARPYTRIPEERRINSLTAGALRGPGKLALPPIVRSRKDEKESVFFLHLGRALCGHEGIVHGGLLATILDESLGRIAILNLPDKVGVTANLNLNYRAPTKADQFVTVRTRVVEQKGRKIIVSGLIEDLQGTVLVEASAVFIQPKYAKFLNTAPIREAMGEPQNSKEPIVEGAVAPVPMSPDVIKAKVVA